MNDVDSFCCEVIQESIILLRLPQVVACTGQSIYHNFVHNNNNNKNNENEKKQDAMMNSMSTAMACGFLASKVEERMRPHLMRDFMKVFNYIYFKRMEGKAVVPDLELGGYRYSRWKRALLHTEREILKNLGFNVYPLTNHPHKYILYYVNTLVQSEKKSLAQMAWSYLNDSLRLDLCVRYQPQTIACAAISLSARVLEIKLPENPHWWKLFDDSTSQEQIDSIGCEILALYERPKVTILPSLLELEKEEQRKEDEYMKQHRAKQLASVVAASNKKKKKQSLLPHLHLHRRPLPVMMMMMMILIARSQEEVVIVQGEIVLDEAEVVIGTDEVEVVIATEEAEVEVEVMIATEEAEVEVEVMIATEEEEKEEEVEVVIEIEEGVEVTIDIIVGVNIIITILVYY